MDKNRYQKKKISLYAVLSYIPFLCFIPIFNFHNLDEFSKKHTKQGFLLLIVEFTALIFLIEFISKVFWIIILFFCLLLSVIGVFRVLFKTEFKIPFIGSIFEKYEI